jgi:hypothetical protein
MATKGGMAMPDTKNPWHWLLLWLGSTAASYAVYAATPRLKPVYHPDVGMAWIDAIGSLGFQTMLFAFLLIATPRLRLWMVVVVPVVGMLMFKFAVMEHLARPLHVLFDGPWLGDNAQDSPFDKQNISANLMLAAALVLMAFWVIPSRRSWDRTAAFLVMLALLFVMTVYHLLVFAAPWPALTGPARAELAAMQELVERNGIPSQEDCPVAPDFACHVFTDDEPFPRAEILLGNPGIAELRRIHEARVPGAPASDPITRILISSNIDDTYVSIHVRRGFFIRQDRRSILIYWGVEGPYATVLANAGAGAGTVFLLAWLGAFVVLSPIHAAAVARAQAARARREEGDADAT